MKKALIIIFTISGFIANAQDHFIGIKGGLSSTNVNEDVFIGDLDNRLGLSAGISYENIFRKHFSVGADLLYQQRGFKNYVIFGNQIGNQGGFGEPTELKYNYNYITMPLYAGFYVGEKLFGFTKIGISPSVLVDARIITEEYEANGKKYPEDVNRVTNNPNRFDFGAQAEIGAGYKLNENLRLNLSLTYFQSLTNHTTNSYFPNSDMKNFGVVMGFGVKYSLKMGMPNLKW
jgi:hypothetical protein